MVTTLVFLCTWCVVYFIQWLTGNDYVDAKMVLSGAVVVGVTDYACSLDFITGGCVFIFVTMLVKVLDEELM